MNKPALIIIGNGMACQRLLQEMQQRNALDLWQITVFGAEAEPAYNRVLLSTLLSGEQPDAAAALWPREQYQALGIRLMTADPVLLIDRASQQVVSRGGVRLSYQKLVLAVGAEPVTPAELQQVAPAQRCYFRNFQDLQRLRAASQQLQHVVVIGGGFLGLEAAEGLRKLGMQVNLLQRPAYLLNRQLDATAAALLADTLRQRGLQVHTSARIARLEHKADGALLAVHLADGQRLQAQLLVLALGISPNLQLAKQCGLQIVRGICVDARLHTSDPAIYALGECAEYQSETFGLLAPIQQQARVLATVLAGESAEFSLVATATQLKISGISLSSSGDIAALEQDPSLSDYCCVYQDVVLGDYRKLWWQQQQLVGAVSYGDTQFSTFYNDLINSSAPYTADRHALLFGPARRTALPTDDIQPAIHSSNGLIQPAAQATTQQAA